MCPVCTSLSLTTDDLLQPFFYTDRSLLKLLLQVAAQAVREVLEDLYPDVRIGMVYTVHTFGRDLGFKPHVHLVITKGGLRKNTWVEIDEIPGNRLASKWRYLLCKALRQAPPHDPDLQRAITQGYHDHRGFQIYTRVSTRKASMLPNTSAAISAILLWQLPI